MNFKISADQLLFLAEQARDREKVTQMIEEAIAGTSHEQLKELLMRQYLMALDAVRVMAGHQKVLGSVLARTGQMLTEEDYRVLSGRSVSLEEIFSDNKNG